MPCKSVLVVEDDQDIRQNVQELLETSGYEAYPAEHGQRALAVLRALPADRLPGAILLDLMMPVMDGRTFAEALAREERRELSGIPILLFTAAGSSRQPEALPGVRRVIRKPVDLDELFEAIETHCGRPEAS